MAKVKVFLSFEYERDQGHYRSFRAEVDCGNSCYEIEDYSLNEPYKLHDSKWLRKAHDQISHSDIVIVVIGEDTHNAPGVKKEVTIANQKRKPIFQIRPKDSTGGAVSGAGDEIPWKWKKINAKISECLKR